MNDLTPHKHGDEGEGSTHYACTEMVRKLGDKTGCCACNQHDCKKLEEKTMTEENAKQPVNDINVAEWEKKYDELFANLGGYDEHEIDKITPLALHFVQAKEFIRSLLTSQRHQLKEQVLEAVGKDEEIVYPNDGGTYFQITPYINQEKAEIRERIEAVFQEKET